VTLWSKDVFEVGLKISDHITTTTTTTTTTTKARQLETKPTGKVVAFHVVPTSGW
jgi:hypothetical protein